LLRKNHQCSYTLAIPPLPTAIIHPRSKLRIITWWSYGDIPVPWQVVIHLIRGLVDGRARKLP
jgi:hypothetical protein